MSSYCKKAPPADESNSIRVRHNGSGAERCAGPGNSGGGTAAVSGCPHHRAGFPAPPRGPVGVRGLSGVSQYAVSVRLSHFTLPSEMRNEAASVTVILI